MHFPVHLACFRGLGKSLQALTALAVLRVERHLQTAPALVVCPASVVMHWEDEVRKYFAADLLCPVRFTPSLSSPGISEIGAAVVIVSYEMARRDVSSGPRSLLRSVLWECVILDEAHLIKNPATGAARAVCSLRSNHRIALSGTPVQNQVRESWLVLKFPRAFLRQFYSFQVEELWSLMNFLLPDYIGILFCFASPFLFISQCISLYF